MSRIRNSMTNGTGLVSIALAVVCAGCGNAPESPEGPSILLLSLDTTRADRIGCYGKEGAGTPNLDSVANRGVRFGRAQTPVPVTLPAHTSLMTGLVPPQHGVRDNVFFEVPGELTTMAELLGSTGYRTGAFLGGMPLHRQYGLQQGFEHYDDEMDPALDKHERRAEDVIDSAIGWLEALPLGERFFAFVHLFDAHAPYLPPPRQEALYAPDLYQAEIAAMDLEIGRLFNAVDHLGEGRSREDTLIIVVADHGESLGEHRESTHAFLVYQSTMHVPFLVAGPNVPSGVVVERPVSLVDVLPTVLDLVEFDPSAQPADLAGSSLRPTWSPDALAAAAEWPRGPVYVETLFPRYSRGWSDLRGLVSGSWKVIEAAGQTELYDLEADPGEIRDVSAEHPERAERLRAQLAAKQSGWPDTEARIDRDVSAKELEAFQSLGYVGEEPIEETERGRHPREMMRLIEETMAARQRSDRGDPEGALARLAELEAEFGEDAGIHQVRGGVLWTLARRNPDLLSQAIESFEAALEINPNHLFNLLKLKDLKLQVGDPEGALEAAERAQVVGPEDPRARLAVLQALKHVIQAEASEAAGAGEEPERLQALRKRLADLEADL